VFIVTIFFVFGKMGACGGLFFYCLDIVSERVGVCGNFVCAWTCSWENISACGGLFSCLGSDSGKYRSQRRFVLFGQCVLKKNRRLRRAIFIVGTLCWNKIVACGGLFLIVRTLFTKATDALADVYAECMLG
jgi:hypothetical protein